MAKSFAQIRRTVPSIHVSRPRTAECFAEVTILEPQLGDCQYENHRYSKDSMEGDGSKRNPYTYRVAAPVSPHYAIVDMWYKFRRESKTRTIFIEVNDWILEVTPKGVRAVCGHFTKLG